MTEHTWTHVNAQLVVDAVRDLAKIMAEDRTGDMHPDDARDSIYNELEVVLDARGGVDADALVGNVTITITDESITDDTIELLLVEHIAGELLDLWAHGNTEATDDEWMALRRGRALGGPALLRIIRVERMSEPEVRGGMFADFEIDPAAAGIDHTLKVWFL